MVKHIVMWNVKGLTQSERQEAALDIKQRFERLQGVVPGLLHLEVGLDISRVDGRAAPDAQARRGVAVGADVVARLLTAAAGHGELRLELRDFARQLLRLGLEFLDGVHRQVVADQCGQRRAG